MDEEVLKKKHDIRKILKTVIDNSTKETENLMKENVNEEINGNLHHLYALFVCSYWYSEFCSLKFFIFVHP